MRPDPARKALCCAIYTRVSTEAGLDQEFNSLDNQREASEAYIKSQAHEGWKLLKDRYDDGGFSGGSMDRPALQALLAAVRARQVDVIVVYKVDRLTRSLSDFAKLVDLFDAHGVSFVSVTQAFNTTTSMGRLTLNVLLSFAQFEREVTSERIRDKIAASKRKGIWMGGAIPLGYRVEARKLLIEPVEAKTVRMIFERYLALKSLPALISELNDRGIVTRRRAYVSGRIVGGVPFSKGPLAWLLKNRIYLGEIVHKGQSHPGEHAAIIDIETFNAVQVQLAANHHEWTNRWQAQGALLTDKIFDDRGNRMTPTYAIKGGVRYRYYVSCVVNQGRSQEAGSMRRVPAPDLEEFVLGECRRRCSPPRSDCADGREADEFDRYALSGSTSGAGVVAGGAASTAHADQIGGDVRTGLVAAVEKVMVSRGRIAITWIQDEGPTSTTEHAWKPPRATPRREILGREEDNSRIWRMCSKERDRIVIAIARGRAWLGEMEIDQDLTISALAMRESLSERSVRMTLNLAFLSPAIVTAAVAGTLSIGSGLGRLSETSMSWRKQAMGVSYA